MVKSEQDDKYDIMQASFLSLGKVKEVAKLKQKILETVK